MRQSTDDVFVAFVEMMFTRNRRRLRVATSSRASGTLNQIQPGVVLSTFVNPSLVRRHAQLAADMQMLALGVKSWDTEGQCDRTSADRSWLETLNRDNKALNRSVLRLCVWPVVGWS